MLAYIHRKVLNREETGAIKILYDIPKSKFTPSCWRDLCNCCKFDCCKCDCCKCKCCSCKQRDVAEELKESRYTWVMENRVEFNRPVAVPKSDPCAICCCQLQVQDHARVQYFDSEMYNSIDLDNPFCHDCKTKCCGSKGDKIVFKRPMVCCPSTKYCGVVVESIYVTKGEGNSTVKIITEARDNARAKMK
ncbi:unnamed protein product [Discosporangium mesarthrocarpum]